MEQGQAVLTAPVRRGPGDGGEESKSVARLLHIWLRFGKGQEGRAMEGLSSRKLHMSGDASDNVGRFLGPNLAGEYILIRSAVYDPESDSTTLGCSVATMEEINALRRAVEQRKAGHNGE